MIEIWKPEFSSGVCSLPSGSSKAGVFLSFSNYIIKIIVLNSLQHSLGSADKKQSVRTEENGCSSWYVVLGNSTFLQKHTWHENSKNNKRFISNVLLHTG